MDNEQNMFQIQQTMLLPCKVQSKYIKKDPKELLSIASDYLTCQISQGN